MAKLKALALTCSLKASPVSSSTDVLTGQVLQALKDHDVEGEMLRVADYNVLPGVEDDMGKGDDWPELRRKMLDADIFILATPTWVGHMSSLAQRVIERLDFELSDSDDQGRLRTFGKVGLAVIVGNEDGAHKITADIFQSLGELGFTIPAGGAVYWNGEAMHTTDYKDLKEIPEAVESTIKTMISNASHLAKLLKANGYPAIE